MSRGYEIFFGRFRTPRRGADEPRRVRPAFFEMVSQTATRLVYPTPPSALVRQIGWV